MKKNVGKEDAYVRYALAIVFLVLAILYSYWFLIGTVILALTGFLGTCGLYSLFGINTCKIDPPKEEE
ncbi:MAG: DUF2892 domain-containing protein [Candidatus Izimaplasma sp.]|nr:DUF2892 domain-containing protein [Candidatus Izimaplasma bacterium]